MKGTASSFPLLAIFAFLALLLLAPLSAAADGAFGSTGPTVNLAVTGTTSRVQFQTTPSAPHIRVYNSGTVTVFIACGDVNIAATLAAGMPIVAGTVEVLGCPQTYVAGISAGTAATIYITPGSGI